MLHFSRPSTKKYLAIRPLFLDELHHFCIMSHFTSKKVGQNVQFCPVFRPLFFAYLDRIFSQILFKNIIKIIKRRGPVNITSPLFSISLIIKSALYFSFPFLLLSLPYQCLSFLLFSISSYLSSLPYLLYSSHFRLRLCPLFSVSAHVCSNLFLFGSNLLRSIPSLFLFRIFS